MNINRSNTHNHTILDTCSQIALQKHFFNLCYNHCWWQTMHCPIFLLKLSLEGYGYKTKCNYKTKNPWEGLKTHFPDSTLLVQGQGRGGRQWWAPMDTECTCGFGMEMTFHVSTKNWKEFRKELPLWNQGKLMHQGSKRESNWAGMNSYKLWMM